MLEYWSLHVTADVYIYIDMNMLRETHVLIFYIDIYISVFYTPPFNFCSPSLPPSVPSSLPPFLSVFTRDELEIALRPVFEVVWNQDPEAYPFRQPVDPIALGIPVSDPPLHRLLSCTSSSPLLECMECLECVEC